MAQYDFTVRAKDETGAFSDRTFNIEVQNNLVDKFVFNSGTDIYTSIDGTSWTKRGGQGYSNGRVYYVNGWWLVTDGNYIYRRSRDGINWIHNTYDDITFVGLDASFDPYLDSMYAYIHEEHLVNPTIINGYAYLWIGSLYGFGSTTASGNLLVKTKDFLEYEVVNYNGITQTQAVADGIAAKFGNTGIAFNETYCSNIIKKDDMFYMTSATYVLRSSDLSSWEHIGTNTAFNYGYLMNLNGIVVSMSNTSTLVRPSGAHQTKVMFSTDMVSWTTSITTPYAGSGYNGGVPMYNNGYFYAVDDLTRYGEFNISSDLQTWTTSQLVDGNLTDLGEFQNFVYEGEIYFVANATSASAALWAHDPVTGVNTLLSNLPAAPSGNIGYLR